MNKKQLLFLVATLFFTFETVSAQLNQGRPAILDEIGVDEQLGNTVPHDIFFKNSYGETVRLGDLFESGKPVLLNPLYYDCPVLCGLVLDAVFNVVNDLVWSPGKDYTIISFSIDPAETPEMAARSKQRYLSDLDRPGAENGWHFLTGSRESIEAVTNAVGFRYKYDELTGEYLHLASIMMLSPEGVVTRYLYGAAFREFDLRNALFEAADGTIGNTLDRVLFYCFTYDPSSQSYVPVAMNIMKLGGLATVIFLGIFLSVFWRREKRSSPSPKFDLNSK
ncbi:MAG: SCO family protein [Balneolaceae bacterium]|nr:MAG: SCO family protein [Balneolaceae bacterium]